ncbi:hypothetical protein BDZ97DRAFT_1804957 [Flammula alnicola]|nr:hypothetical protein BDZ97DRAFT_1804957 [Flammula alnicola]
MFSISNPRQRTHSQSFDHSLPYHPQEYYLPAATPSHISLGASESAHRPFSGDNSGRDLYQPSNGSLYNNARHTESISYNNRQSLAPPMTYSQSYDRHPNGSSDLHSPLESYNGHHYGDSSRSDLSFLGRVKGSDMPNILDTFSMSGNHQNFLPESSSAMSGPFAEHSGGSEFWPGNAHEASQPEQQKPRKPRREKPRIELAPDQPPTTQGKPRARVYVACLQCRTRKIRCDGAKPTCHNCGRRANGNNDCNYDPVPKRRGPDKTPGARQRMARDVKNEIDNAPSRRRRRTRDNSTSNTDQTNQQQQKLLTRQPSTAPESPQNYRHSPNDSASLTDEIPTASDFGSVSNYSRSSYSPCRCLGLADCQGPSSAGSLCNPRKSVSVMTTYHEIYDPANTTPPCSASPASRGYIAEVDENGNEKRDPNKPDIGREPSLAFSRKIWWDSLLSLYLSPDSTRLQKLTVSQRESAAQSITSDLRLIFRASNYWFSFFHIPTFFSNFFDPVRRERIQPSLVLALLAMSTFWQSSEVGYGKAGRERALRFRDEAQAAMEASFNAGWVDETLAQAAWLLALFEVCAHPRHSSERSSSSMVMLDSIIRSLSLTLVDADDPNTSVFSPGKVPVVTSPQRRTVPLPTRPHSRSSPVSSYLHSPSSTHPNNEKGCSCQLFTLAEHWPSTQDHAPMWGATPAWDDSWTEADIRKESCRRLCWSSTILAAGHSSYTTAHRSESLDLFISDPANYALLFSGESVARSPMLSNYSSKDTIWALHDRSFLLWHGCIRMRNNKTAADTDKAQFALRAWLEADALEQALNRHTCSIERAFIYQAREYIFNTRMCISYEFQRYIPLVTADVSGLFHRSKAEEWLTHQATVAEQFMRGLHTITGNSNNLLARRPFFVFWFMGQIHRALALWEYDNSLSIALQVCKALMPGIDYLTALWPCPEQRRRYELLREKVATSCYNAGLEPPPPIDLSLPPPSSLEALG